MHASTRAGIGGIGGLAASLVARTTTKSLTAPNLNLPERALFSAGPTTARDAQRAALAALHAPNFLRRLRGGRRRRR
ncbi:hypothetical protein, partial [Xanthomonas perforans]|uniref:hypothetical protein n=6 Tax=Xanthomonas perforans TaxID=442694 RepID=UPI001C948C38